MRLRRSSRTALRGRCRSAQSGVNNEGLPVTYAGDFQGHLARASENAHRPDYLSPSTPESHWAKEQRAWPRVHGEFPVALRNGLGQHCAATLRNLSPDGLQVRCNVQTARIVHPLGGPLVAGEQPLLHATVVLPLSDGPQTLSAGVRLLHLAAAEAPFCILGFRFLDLRPRARRIIDAFYAEQLRRGDH